MKSEATNRPDRPDEVLRRMSRDGANLSYRVIGDGQCLVLIPSLGRGSEDFDLIVPRLSQSGFRLILPEPRGIAGSSKLEKTDTLHDMASDIAAIIEAEGAAPAVLVGHAAGNWVARVLAHDRPDLTRAMALLAAIITNVVPKEVSASISASFNMALSDEERLSHLQRVYFAPGADASVWLDGWWPEVSAAQRQAAKNTPGKAWIRVADHHPTLYVAASQDVISPPPDLASLRDTIGTRVDCVIIENAGHALLPEQPEAVARAIATWIEGLCEAGQ